MGAFALDHSRIGIHRIDGIHDLSGFILFLEYTDSRVNGIQLTQNKRNGKIWQGFHINGKGRIVLFWELIFCIFHSS